MGCKSTSGGGERVLEILLRNQLNYNIMNGKANLCDHFESKSARIINNFDIYEYLGPQISTTGYFMGLKLKPHIYWYFDD